MLALVVLVLVASAGGSYGFGWFLGKVKEVASSSDWVFL